MTVMIMMTEWMECEGGRRLSYHLKMSAVAAVDDRLHWQS